MNFQLLRVKRRADQDPASTLYLPVDSDNKRSRTEPDDSKEFRLFKMVERGNSQPKRIIRPTERNNSTEISSKVILLTDSFESSNVAEAILVHNNDKLDKNEISKLINPDFSDRFESVNINDDPMNGEFVYDVYRMDLGRFSSKDIEGKTNCVQIVTYEQEFHTDEEGTESEVFEDDDDSNAEGYYANDYPDEEEYFSGDEIEDFDDDDFLFNKSFEIADFDHKKGFCSENGQSDFDSEDAHFDLDADDYDCFEDSFTEYSDEGEVNYCYDHNSE